MSFVYYLSVILVMVSLVAIVAGLIRPSTLSKFFGKNAGRIKITSILIGAIIILSVVVSATEPESVKLERLHKEQAKVAAAEKQINEEQAKSEIEPVAQPAPAQKPKKKVVNTYVVSRIVDGDTIEVYARGKSVKIRLIGIDTPEKNDKRKPVQCFATEASKKLEDLIMGKRVILENDSSQSNQDKYARLLRYIKIDGININKVMIEEGYAYEYTYNVPYKYQAEFKTAQQTASANSKGLWAASTCAGKREKPKPAPAPQAQVAPTPTPTYVPAPSPAPSGSDVYYANCTAARAAGAAPIYSGQPGYRSALDRDSDGIACE